MRVENYLLKHRDVELLSFTWSQFSSPHIESVNDKARHLLPIAFGSVLTNEKLEDWLYSRTAPMGRHFMRDLMGSLGLNMRGLDFHRRALELSKGLSLNDDYWVVPSDFDGEWSSSNLYDNHFSEAMAEIAFTGHGKLDPKEATTSPEMTTNGMLPKCWRREADGIYLYKGATGQKGEGLEPYSEYYAAQIAQALGFKHVSYDLVHFKGKLCSKCKLFTSDKYGFLPASKLPEREAILKEPSFVESFLLDAIIFNTDRHLGNFGFLVDNDTNKIVSAAPIFDNGYGLLSHFNIPANDIDNDFRGVLGYLKMQHSSLLESWMAFPYELSETLLEKLAALKSFKFKRHKHYNLPEERLKVLERFIQKRAGDILKFGKKADSLLEISTSDDGINPKEETPDDGINREGLSKNEERAIQAILRNSQVTAAELANQLGVKPRQAERIIAALKAKAGLKRRGAKKNGEWYFEE